MDDESPAARAAYLRDIAERLRSIAANLLDLRKKAQIQALADGYERSARRADQAAQDEEAR